MKIGIYVAIAANSVIGRDNGLPWRLSTDMQRFKAGTMGKPIVMGRKTWQSFPKRPLPGRLNIVITRDRNFQADGAEIVHSLEEALAVSAAKSPDAGEICIIGGAEIYSQAIAIADRLYVTHVLADVDGDAHFPAIDAAKWRIVSAEDFPAGERDSHPTRYSVYERQ